jgi:hypothetical protein
VQTPAQDAARDEAEILRKQMSVVAVDFRHMFFETVLVKVRFMQWPGVRSGLRQKLPLRLNKRF